MCSPEKGNPCSTVNLAEEVETGVVGLTGLSCRLDRYGLARERALLNLSQVRQRSKGGLDSYSQHLDRVQARLSMCGNYLGFKHYYTVDKLRLTSARFCKAHLLCPLCAIRRGSKMVETLVQRYNIITAENAGLKMSMITFTVKNGDDLKERYEHLKKSIQALQLRRRVFLSTGRGYTEFSKVLGLVGTYEVTKDGAKDGSKSGWHPHVHMMVLHRERINAAALKREWKAITGDSHVLRIDPARHPNDPGQDFLEVCKYALKFGDLTPEQNLEAYEVLHGKRLIISAGLFWGLEIPEELTDEPLDELPYFELLYKYIAGSGYNLTTRDKLHDS